MATLGVHYQPDKMLIGDGTQPFFHPEWAVRAPVVLLTIVALYLLYKGVSKTFGRRAAFIGGLVLATMPDWFFIAHQTMTDMPFVGAMTACMGLVLIGLRTPEDVEVRAYEMKVGRTRWRLTAWHLVFGAILVCVLPQVLYLVSRNFEFLWKPGAHGFRPHWDEFWSGSGGGNCGLPGNEDCHLTTPASIPHSVGANPDGFLPGAVAHRRRLRARAAGPALGGGARPRALHELGRAPDAAPLLPRGVVFRGHLDARQGPRGLRAADARHLRVPLRVASRRRALRPPPAHRPRAHAVRDPRRSARSSSRWRCPGTWRCTSATGARSPTGSSSTTCSTARSTTFTTRTRGTTRASASTSGSSGTRSSRGPGSRRWGCSGGCAAARPPRTTIAPTRRCCSACGSSSPSPSSRSWGRSSTTTSSPRSRRSRCSSASSSTTCWARRKLAEGALVRRVPRRCSAASR